MISSAFARRCCRGFSVTVIRPLLGVRFVPSAPTKDATRSTSGSDRSTSESFFVLPPAAETMHPEPLPIRPPQCRCLAVERILWESESPAHRQRHRPNRHHKVSQADAAAQTEDRDHRPQTSWQSRAQKSAGGLPIPLAAFRVVAECALIVAVSVNESTCRHRTATLNVTANSRNSRPIRPVINRSGISTAMSDTVSETIVKPICLAPLTQPQTALPQLRCSARCFRSSQSHRRRQNRSKWSAPSATDCSDCIPKDTSHRMSR